MRAQFLPGFSQSGDNFTYAVAGQSTITGILLKPPGNGPFPGVIISHGKGPGLNFTLGKAQEMVNWGFVCIGPRYAHASEDPDFGNASMEGARPENLRRAEACLRILQSLPYVRGNRICAYGNSMGAFVTIQFTANHTDQLRASAITAGGVIPSGEAATPTSAEAGPIRTPFLMLHGEIDGTVPPQRSELLKQVLDGNGVANQRITWPNVDHDLHVVKATEVYQHIRNWFTTYGAFANETVRSPDRPRGIYVLDTALGTPHNGATLRDAAIRSYGFVKGYALRSSWEFMETAENFYDFTIIDNILTKLPVGQKLSLILTPFDPPYIAAKPGVTTWTDEDRNGNPLLRAVPWDPYLRERRRAFLVALASHITTGTAFRDQPALDVIDPYLPGGFTGIRDPNTSNISTLPGYTRALYLEAVADELRTLTGQFPNKFVQLGFWKVTDANNTTAAWEEIRQTLLADFNGMLRPKVGFFMENLAASRPGAGVDPVTGYPATDFAAPLYLSRDNTWTALQALTSWFAPFTGHAKVANATPMDGISYGYSSYGCRYFELYGNDTDQAAWQPGLTQWSQTLEGTSSAGDWALFE